MDKLVVIQSTNGQTDAPGVEEGNEGWRKGKKGGRKEDMKK